MATPRSHRRGKRHRTQRLLNRAVWDTLGAMSQVRRFVVAGLTRAASRRGRRGLVIGALDETGHAKAAVATCGVKRQYMGCAGRVANGINTVRLSYVRQRVGHALIGARQWIPAEQVTDPVVAARVGLPEGLAFRTKGRLAIDLCSEAYADGVGFERAAQWDQLPDLDEAITAIEGELARAGLRGHLTPPERQTKPRKARTTRRRQDTPELPRLPVQARTVGRAYAGRDGRVYRPSMLLTLTLGSYGPVHSAVRRGAYLVACQCGQRHGERDDLLGTPIDPAGYNYRRAALDAIHFARVVDRWWQNLRRAAGWNVQYAGSVEMQRRLAPHAHFAIRGTLPRRLLKQVAAATYHQVWWPRFDEPVYPIDRPPVWDATAAAYVDPRTGTRLPTWEQAAEDVDTPAYVARLGTIDPREIKGVQGGGKDAERCIRYVTKYQTKDLVSRYQPAPTHSGHTWTGCTRS